MRRDTMWSIAAGALFIGGITALFFAWNYQGRTSDTPGLPSNLPLATDLPVDPNFNPQSNTKLSFEAVAVITPEKDSEFTMKVQHDGRGTARFEGSQDGSATEFFITPQNRVFCDDLNCYETELDPSDKEFSIDEFVFDPQDMRELGQGLVLAGEEPCGQSTCEVWSSPSPVDIDAPRVLLDKTTKNIIEVSGKQDKEFVKITYTYKEVKVVLPLNIIKSEQP